MEYKVILDGPIPFTQKENGLKKGFRTIGLPALGPILLRSKNLHLQNEFRFGIEFRFFYV